MNPINRREAYLMGIINGDAPNCEPATREEALLAKIIETRCGDSAACWDDLGKVEKTGLVTEKELLFENDFGSVTGGPGGFPYNTDYPEINVTLPVDENGNLYPSLDFVISINGVEQEVTGELTSSGGPVESYVVDGGDVILAIRDYGRVSFTFNVAGTYNVALYHVGGEVENTVTEIVPMPVEYLPEHLHFGKVEKVEMVAGKELLFEHTLEYSGPNGGSMTIGPYYFTLPLDENGEPLSTMDFVVSVNGEEQEVTAEFIPPSGPGYGKYEASVSSLTVNVLYDGNGQFYAPGLTSYENGTFDIALYHAKAVETTVVKTVPMAEEYMPLLTSPNGTKYKLTVADDGTLSATVVAE